MIQRGHPLLVIAVQRWIDTEEQQVLRIEADIDMAQVLERPKEEARPDQQHERNRDLHDQQRLAEEAPRADDAAARLLERGIDVHAGAAEGRRNPEQQTG